MRLALLRPRYHTHLVTPPLGLGYLASSLRAAGHAPLVLDGLLLDLGPEQLAARCAGLPWAGISVLSDTLPEVRALTASLQRAGVRVAVGGPHVTALPVQALAFTGADLAVVGEGEATLAELAGVLEAGGDPGAVPGVLVPGRDPAPARPLRDDLDALPFPAWDALPPRRYGRAPHGAFVARLPVAPVITTRGCPCRCSFCASPRLWGGRIRFRSPENVLGEIGQLVRHHGVREIHFEDDNLTLRRAHVEAICEGLIRRGPRVSWACPNGVRTDTLDRDLLRLMRRSGCYALAFGVESGDQAVLDRAAKGTRLEEVERAIALAAAEGLQTQGFFILGLPGETEASLARTVEFARRSRLDRAQFLVLDVFPGSALWDELAGQFEPDWTRRSFQEVGWCPPGLDPARLQAAQAQAFRAFFLRHPRRLARLLRRARPRQLPMALRRLRDFGILPRLG